MRKQLDNRWKQIDKFEGSLRTYAETKAGWKRKLSQREGELEALRVRRLCLRASLGFKSLSQRLPTPICLHNWQA